VFGISPEGIALPGGGAGVGHIPPPRAAPAEGLLPARRPGVGLARLPRGFRQATLLLLLHRLPLAPPLRGVPPVRRGGLRAVGAGVPGLRDVGLGGLAEGEGLGPQVGDGRPDVLHEDGGQL